MTNNNSVQNPATLDEVVSALNKNNALLEEVATWLKIIGHEKVKNLLASELGTPEKVLTYHLSDGKSTREVGAFCNIDFGTVAKYWRTWHKIGLMRPVPTRGGGDRFIKNFDLKDFGIEVTKIAPKQEKRDKSQIALKAPDEATVVLPDRGNIQ